MKTFGVKVQWNHKGTKYPVSASLVVKGSSFAIAANKAVRLVKKSNAKSWREPVGASIRVDIILTDNERGGRDGEA